MAKVMFARLCREIKKSQQSGLYILMGGFDHIKWIRDPVRFVCVVYWAKANQTFRQSFVLRDEAGIILDQPPSTECVLTIPGENVSTAFFYTSFAQAGFYNIKVYEDGVCIETLPLEVREASQISESHLARLSPFESATPG